MFGRNPSGQLVVFRVNADGEIIVDAENLVPLLDGLETLVGATNTAVGSSNTLATTLNGYVDGLEALATTLNGYVDGLEGLLSATLKTSADVSAAAGGIATIHRLVSAAASNNATSVKASAGRLYRLKGINHAAGYRYLKIYNKASTPAPGSDNALIMDVFEIAPNSSFEYALSPGIYCSAGIAYAIVTGSADTDNTSATAGDITHLSIYYA